MSSKQESVRKHVYNFYIDNKSMGKKFTVNHFLAEKIPQSTIYDIIQRAENETGYERAPGSGRVAKIMNSGNIERLIEDFDHNDSISQTQAARKYGCSQKHISTTLATKTTIRVRKKTPIPKRNDEQKRQAKFKCGRLYRNFRGLNWVIDDETYLTLAHTTINGNNLFYTSDVNETPSSVKYTEMAKYEEKLCLWSAISNKGICKPYFALPRTMVNSELYLKECIKKRLMPFIEENHSDGDYIFWPDKAAPHYSDMVTEYFMENDVNYVDKDDNPTNLPECRPIEKFWSILKGHVYKNNWQAKDLHKLKERIQRCWNKVNQTTVKDLANSVQRRIDAVRRNGVM